MTECNEMNKLNLYEATNFFICEDPCKYVSYYKGEDEITLDGIFTFQELKQIIEACEGK